MFKLRENYKGNEELSYVLENVFESVQLEMFMPNEIAYIINRTNEIRHDVLIEIARKTNETLVEDRLKKENIDFVQFYAQWCTDCLAFALQRENK